MKKKLKPGDGWIITPIHGNGYTVYSMRVVLNKEVTRYIVLRDNEEWLFYDLLGQKLRNCEIYEPWVYALNRIISQATYKYALSENDALILEKHNTLMRPENDT